MWHCQQVRVPGRDYPGGDAVHPGVEVVGAFRVQFARNPGRYDGQVLLDGNGLVQALKNGNRSAPCRGGGLGLLTAV